MSRIETTSAGPWEANQQTQQAIQAAYELYSLGIRDFGNNPVDILREIRK